MPEDNIALILALRNLLITPFNTVTMTAKQREAVTLATKGYTARESAEILGINIKVLEDRVRKGAAKLDVTPRELPKLFFLKLEALLELG